MENSSRSLMMTITAAGIAKDFNRRSVFKEISFALTTPSSLAITGRNGAGKSALMKIVAGLLSPTGGTMTYAADGKSISVEEFKRYVGFVSPYLNLYDEFTALENLSILSRIRSSGRYDEQRAKILLESMELWSRRNDDVGTFSSGMKQRMKYAFALLHEPPVLFLDEPNANLDEEGIAIVRSAVEEQKRDHILIMATNNKEEAAWCRQEIRVGSLS